MTKMSITAAVSYWDHMEKWEIPIFNYSSCQMLLSAVSSRGLFKVKTSPVKKVPISNSASLCRVCGSEVYVDGGFYSQVAGKLGKQNISLRIAELLWVEDVIKITMGQHSHPTMDFF